MDDERNLSIYKRWAPFYDLVMIPLYGAARKNALALLDLKGGEKLLIVGVGTGLDIPYLPKQAQITGIDLSPDMLAVAQERAQKRKIELKVMNAQALEFADGCFDAVLLNLILSVVPDGAAAFAEAWRVVRPGGRIIIFDKFLPENGSVTPVRGFIGRVAKAIGTDPNRKLSEILGMREGLKVESNHPSLLHGQYRILQVNKEKKNQADLREKKDISRKVFL